jgi:hypothetical protein
MFQCGFGVRFAVQIGGGVMGCGGVLMGLGGVGMCGLGHVMVSLFWLWAMPRHCEIPVVRTNARRGIMPACIPQPCTAAAVKQANRALQRGNAPGMTQASIALPSPTN